MIELWARVAGVGILDSREAGVRGGRSEGGPFRALRHACLALAVLLPPVHAFAWTTIHHGVEYQQWAETSSEGVTVQLYGLRIDTAKLEALHLNGTSAFLVTPEAYAYPPDGTGARALHTTSEFSSAHALDVAINGTFFYDATYGPTVSGGAEWSSVHEYCFGQPDPTLCYAGEMLVFGERDAGDSPDTPHYEHWWEHGSSALDHFEATYSSVSNLLSNTPYLVVGGVRAHGIEVYADEECPRTAVGVSEDHRTLFLVVVDGGTTGVRQGMYYHRLADTLVELGVYDGFALDGGGSSTMVVESMGGVVNHPSDGSERSVLTHLGLRVPDLNVEWLTDTIPDQMTAGVVYDVALQGLNPIGPWSWTDDPTIHPDNLAAVGEGTALFHVDGEWLGSNRIETLDVWIDPGEEHLFEFQLQAPDDPGSYTLGFHMVRDGETWYGGAIHWKEVVVGECECEQGDTDSQPCGVCGAQTRICGDDCLWGDYSSCVDPCLDEPSDDDADDGDGSDGNSSHSECSCETTWSTVDGRRPVAVAILSCALLFRRRAGS